MLRDYVYHEATMSLCPTCMATVQAKVVIQDGGVLLLKYCPEHGEQVELLEEDSAYHLSKREFDKPATVMPVYTRVAKGCPFDCGTCPQHDQHACIGLIEVTNRCNLSCPLCYAGSGRGDFLPMETIEKMLDFFQESERGEAEVLQFSGGEPTLHPEILRIIRTAKARGIKYVMLNTNGLRLARDEDFVKGLREFADAGGFEVYLQFDGFRATTHEQLRGRDLREVKERAVANLMKYRIPTTLVMTVFAGINDDEVGEVFSYALNKPCIRGINYQPAAFFGRQEVGAGPSGSDRRHRVTLSGVLRRLEQQTSGLLKQSDFIPLPCNVERVALTYLYRSAAGEFVPITRDVNFRKHVGLVNNTFFFTVESVLKDAGSHLDGFGAACGCYDFLKDFQKMVPVNFLLRSREKKKEYVDANTFRLSVSSFVDAYNFDLKSMQKECVHVITPDLRKIPFSAYNMIHRQP